MSNPTMPDEIVVDVAELQQMFTFTNEMITQLKTTLAGYSAPPMLLAAFDKARAANEEIIRELESLYDQYRVDPT